MKFNTFGSYNENQSSDYAEDVIDAETGEALKKIWKPRQGKNEVALRLVLDFKKRADSVSGNKNQYGKNEYFAVLGAMKRHNMSEQNILSYFDFWFRKEMKREEIISLTRALSNINLNAYKLQ